MTNPIISSTSASAAINSSPTTSSITSISSATPPRTFLRAVRHMIDNNSSASSLSSMVQTSVQSSRSPSAFTERAEGSLSSASSNSLASLISASNSSYTASSTVADSLSNSSSSESSSSTLSSSLDERKEALPALAPSESESKSPQTLDLPSTQSNSRGQKRKMPSAEQHEDDRSSSSTEAEENALKKTRLVDGFNDECSICKMAIDPETGPVTRLKCRHIYHLDCLAPWFQGHNSCPMCRSAITTNQVAQNNINNSSSSPSVTTLLPSSSVSVTQPYIDLNSVLGNVFSSVRLAQPASTTFTIRAGPIIYTSGNESITITTTQPRASTVRDSTYELDGYRIYRDGTSDRIDSSENIRLINYRASHVESHFGNIIIEGTSVVGTVTANRGNIYLKGGAKVTNATANRGSISLQDSSTAETTRANVGGVRDIRTNPTGLASNSASSTPTTTISSNVITMNNVSETIVTSTGINSSHNLNSSQQTNTEEVIGGNGSSLTIGTHIASSKTVRVRSGAVIAKIIFPTPLGIGTVILEGTGTVGEIENGALATAPSSTHTQ